MRENKSRPGAGYTGSGGNGKHSGAFDSHYTPIAARGNMREGGR